MSKTICQLGLLCALCGLCACGSRQHMREDYGRQTRQFFSKQRVNTQATQGSPSGLDSEEAALIQSSYKHSLGKEQAAPEGQSRVMLLKDTDDDRSGP